MRWNSPACQYRPVGLESGAKLPRKTQNGTSAGAAAGKIISSLALRCSGKSALEKVKKFWGLPHFLEIICARLRAAASLTGTSTRIRAGPKAESGVQPVAVHFGIPSLHFPTAQPPTLRKCAGCSCASAHFTLPISGLLASLCPHLDTDVCLLAPAIGRPKCHSASAVSALTAQGSHSEPQSGSIVLYLRVANTASAPERDRFSDISRKSFQIKS
jgi:hypothetical protein